MGAMGGPDRHRREHSQQRESAPDNNKDGGHDALFLSAQDEYLQQYSHPFLRPNWDRQERLYQERPAE